MSMVEFHHPNSSVQDQRQMFMYRKVLVFFAVLMIGLVCLINLPYQYYYNGSLSIWSVYDWLINYQGGFTRRGFAGEIIYLIASWLYISPLYILLFVQSFLVVSLFYNTWKILMMQKDTIRHLIVMYSPAFFASFVFSGITERKDILYFAVMSYVVRLYMEDRFSKIKQIIYFFIVYPSLILTHEIFFALFPYSLFFIRGKKQTILYSIPSILTFALIMISHRFTTYLQAKEQIKAIISSYHKFGIYLANAGAINWLEFNSYQGFQYVEYHYLRHFMWLIYLIMIIYNIAILVFFYQKRFNKRIVFYALLSAGLMLPVFVVAIDWARFIIFECISLWFILLSEYNEITPFAIKFDNIMSKIPNVFIVLDLIILYGGIFGVNLTTTFPNAFLGYATNMIYNMVYGRKIIYNHELQRMQIGCKVVQCPSSYPQKLKKAFKLHLSQKNIDPSTLKVLYLADCFIRPNPYISYITVDKYCYKIANRLTQAIRLNKY